MAQPLNETRSDTPLRIVMFGTPAFAVPTLETLASDPRFSVVLAVTQPERPAGRGQRLAASPVKAAASALGLPIYQPERLRTGEQVAPLRDIGADLFVVAAYGQIFGREMLAMPRLGCINLHASLLPAYRGASPVSAAIAAQETHTGVSLMRMERGLDTGPVIATIAVDIAPDDTTAMLTDKLAVAGATLANGALPGYAAGDLKPVAQEGPATLTRPMVKADGWVDWHANATAIDAQVRAMWPWPRAWTTVTPAGGEAWPLQIHRASHVTDESTGTSGEPGRIIGDGRELLVETAAGLLSLDTVQEPGGRPVPGATVIARGRLAPGDVLGRVGAPEPPPPLIRLVDS